YNGQEKWSVWSSQLDRLATLVELKETSAAAYSLLEGHALAVANGMSDEDLKGWSKFKEKMQEAFGTIPYEAFKKVQGLRLEDYPSVEC
ncbi:hypothetical protein Ciccas_008932, partial [Cichlidogyrus casuarinus]